MHHASLAGTRAALILAAAIAAGCQQTSTNKEPEAPRTGSAQASAEIEARAVVRSVDKETRAITLQRDDGSLCVLVAGPVVKNFDQIEPGDNLRVRYRESVVARLKAPGEPTAAPSGAIAAGAAAPGAKPAGAIGEQITATVRIESVDTARSIVVFTNPAGELRALRVVRPEGRELLNKLRPNDMVEITITEAIAISVQKD